MIGFAKAALLLALCGATRANMLETETKCPGDLVPKFCGTACPKLCSDESTGDAMCVAMCKEGCFCEHSHQWLDEKTNTCYENFRACPGNHDMVLETTEPNFG